MSLLRGAARGGIGERGHMADIIEPLGVQHALDLQPVVTNPSVMRFIANGRVWSQDKLQRMLAQSDEEWHSQTRGRKGRAG